MSLVIVVDLHVYHQEKSNFTHCLSRAILNEQSGCDVECESVQSSHDGDVKRVVWHPYEDLLASVGYDNRINVFKHSLSEGDWVGHAQVSDHESTVWSADFDVTGSRIVSCSDDRTLRFHNLSLDKAPPCAFDMEYLRPIYDVSWNRFNGLIATGCGDNLLRVLKETRFDYCVTLDVKSHDGDVNRVKWNPKAENFLVSCGDDSSVKLWKWFNPD